MGRYALALASVLLVGWIEHAARNLLQDRAHFVLLLTSVCFSAWSGGLGPGLLSLAASCLLGSFLLAEPLFSMRIANRADLVSLALYAFVGGVVLCFVERGRADARRIEERESEVRRVNASLQAANERLSSLATMDGLTEVLNHRAFQDRLEEEIARAHRSGLPLSVVLLDVDRFKAFNDDHGHQAGDAVLRGVAAALCGTARTIDTVARYGGEEFAVVLPGAEVGAAFAAAERLRRAIEAMRPDAGSVTASLGVATLGPDMDRESLIGAADRALYRSKREGRNRTTSADAAPT